MGFSTLKRGIISCAAAWLFIWVLFKKMEAFYNWKSHRVRGHFIVAAIYSGWINTQWLSSNRNEEWNTILQGLFNNLPAYNLGPAYNLESFTVGGPSFIRGLANLICGAYMEPLYVWHSPRVLSWSVHVSIQNEEFNGPYRGWEYSQM